LGRNQPCFDLLAVSQVGKHMTRCDLITFMDQDICNMTGYLESQV
jgi:hypothetical protein